MTVWSASATALFLVLAAGPPSEATPGDAEIEANLEVDTSGTGTGGPVIQRRIQERASVVMRQGAVLPGDSASPTLRVVVVEQEEDEPGFRLELTLTEAGSRRPTHSRSIVCSLCTESELVSRAEREIADLIPLLEQMSRKPGEAPEPAPAAPTEPGAAEPSVPTDDPGGASADDPDRGRAMFRSGIGLLAVGAAGVGVGVGLFVAPPRPASDDPRYEIRTRAPGAAILATGAAFTIVGAVLTGVGASRRAKSSERTRLDVAWGPDHWGVVLHGRF